MSDPKHSFLHELFLKHAHEVSAFIRGRWPREQDVDDIMQEFSQLIRRCVLNLVFIFVA
ncbi:hypothetical protein [Methylobacter tundripaludum]|uniref:hypothetical protein n=1 Tax=Methylobacter tundripaludum TaxID=173365 RepID=UPI000AC7483C|nr:hypothetical protein [Methylobacter tundripaludum]